MQILRLMLKIGLGCLICVTIIGGLTVMLLYQRSHKKDVSTILMENIDGERIKANLRLLTKEPHVAGTEANERVAKKIEKLFIKAGLQGVHTTSYDVLLSYPDWSTPNRLTISDASGHKVYATRDTAPPLVRAEQNDAVAGTPWIAYSAAGTASGDVVYCNYGREEDFTALAKLGIDLKGRIALMRYGKGFRGNKVQNAERAGARAAVIFSDPAEVATAGTSNVFPHSVWMPEEATQSGSLIIDNGDPQTPLYPAKPGAYKWRTIEEAQKELLPSIPAMPIGYATAFQILTRMGGPVAPNDWQGLLNITYRLGPGLIKGENVTVEVRSKLENKKIQNIIGYIPGALDEDRYVILGNHYDAWGYGALDPNSGTSAMIEVARAYTKTMNETGWRPARSLMFAAWDAEEYGLIGSQEFVEEFVQQLGSRAVAYLNVDCFKGNYTIDVNTVPSLFDVITEASKVIPNPVKAEVQKGRATLYDTWVHRFPGGPNGMPKMDLPGANSDHSSFLIFAGIPVADFRFVNDSNHKTYPLYHTLYETPFVSEHLYDTDDFAIHRATGQFWGEIARRLADSPVVPLNASRMAWELNNVYVFGLSQDFSTLPVDDAMSDAVSQLATLIAAVEDFANTTKIFYESTVVEAKDAKRLHAVNERLVMLERCFLNPRGSLGVPFNRHVLYSVSSGNGYAASTLAGVRDMMAAYISSDKKGRPRAGRFIAEQISIVYHSVNCAINTLKRFI